MKEKYSDLHVCVYTVDGSTRTFIQSDPDLINRTLTEFHPASAFNRDRITIVDEETEVALVLPLITRIDLMTERLSVWDFPFVLGALTEVTEAEFTEGLHGLEEWEHGGPQTGIPVFLDLEMVNGQRLFLWMRTVAGLPATRLEKVYSLLKERHLIFGLRTAGIGLLNLSNLVRFSVHPEPPKRTVAALRASIPSPYDDDIAPGINEHKQAQNARQISRENTYE